jgi:precorrin-2/cobalt-factor-2 C20-methyltransferase
LEKGIFYGVGVGPGDPELLTLKAVRVLREADVIAVPDTGKGEKTAESIAREYIAGKEILYCASPMGAERRLTEAGYDLAARQIAEILARGRSVAFITLGDPSVYSTFAYVRRRVVGLGYCSETVPGVTSFCAASARLGESLCEGREPLAILPGACADLDAYLALPGNKVIMKSGAKLPELTASLIAQRRFDVAVAANCGMENERLAHGEAALGEDLGYFSMILLKDRR